MFSRSSLNSMLFRDWLLLLKELKLERLYRLFLLFILRGADWRSISSTISKSISLFVI